MAEQDSAPSQQADYNAWHKAAWDEIHQFCAAVAKSEWDYFAPNNPQHRLAPEFFQFYLENRHSKHAEHALSLPSPCGVTCEG